MLTTLQIEIENWILSTNKKVVELEDGEAMENTLHSFCREVRPL
jgi:hypothetical protein